MKDEKRYGSYAEEEEAILNDDDYPFEGDKAAAIQQRVKEKFNSLTPEELKGYTDQGMSGEDIMRDLFEEVSASMQGPRP